MRSCGHRAVDRVKSATIISRLCGTLAAGVCGIVEVPVCPDTMFVEPHTSRLDPVLVVGRDPHKAGRPIPLSLRGTGSADALQILLFAWKHLSGNHAIAFRWGTRFNLR